jgi:hypothetical protein
LHLSKELFFLNSGTTWASFNFSGKMELFIDLFIKFVIGLTIAGFNKGSHITKDIILEDNNKIINDQLQVANNFNNFFINVAKDIGNDNDLSAEEHIFLEKWNYLLIYLLNLLLV